MQIEDELIDLTEDDFPSPVRCSLITGSAGTGKTYTVRERIAKEPKEGVLCATTGIAAVNLNTITINALLRYFDTDSLTNAYISGKLTTRLATIAKQFRNLYVDEVSMMAAEQLDIIYQATQAANRQKGVQKVNPDGLGIVLTGDFAQLPPIKARWAFEADCWSEFESNLVRLTTNWRQAEGRFLDSVNCFRAGRGDDGASLLRETSARFTNALNLDFDGTTIMSKNDEVDRFNWVALRRLKTPSFKIPSDRWSVNNPPGEWKFIPMELELKVGAYVMVLANQRDFEYANGDCGWVVDYEPDADTVSVKLARTGEIVEVGMIERLAQTDDYDDKGDIPVYTKADYASGEPRPWEAVHFDQVSEKYVIGGIRYIPLRLAWASTVHKSQGLTLDRVQLDIRNAFFGNPAMTYVAVSRCRSAEGLRIVGTEKLLAQRCKIDPRITRWI